MAGHMLQQGLLQQFSLRALSSAIRSGVRGFAGGGYANISEHEKGKTKFSGYYDAGFVINNVKVPGSVLVYTDTYLMWKPRRMSEVTPESLVFLELIKPAPEVLVLGCGEMVQKIPPAVAEYLKKLDISSEVLDSRNATGYFNVLNDDGRVAVAALLAMDADVPIPKIMPKIENPVVEIGWESTNKVNR